MSNLVCTEWIRHKDKTAKYRRFVMLGDGRALLGVPNIEVLVIWKITCEMMGEHIKPGCSTPKQCRYPIAIDGKQTKLNRSRQLIFI